jgi:hypothetical protein
VQAGTDGKHDKYISTSCCFACEVLSDRLFMDAARGCCSALHPAYPSRWVTPSDLAFSLFEGPAGSVLSICILLSIHGTKSVHRGFDPCGDSNARRGHRTAALHLCGLWETQPLPHPRPGGKMGARNPPRADPKVSEGSDQHMKISDMKRRFPYLDRDSLVGLRVAFSISRPLSHGSEISPCCNCCG